MYRQQRGRLHHFFHPYLQPRPLYTGIHQPHQQTDDIRKECIDVVEEKIRVDTDDKTAARELVDTLLRSIIAKVRQQRGGEIYGVKVTKAGSYPVNTKIGKPDEFDTNIMLNLSLDHVHREGTIEYSFESEMRGDSTTTTLQHTAQPVDIPPGHCVIEVDKESVLQKFQHRVTPQNPRFHHLALMYGITQRELDSHEILLNGGIYEDGIQLIPKDIKDDLLLKLRKALKTLELEGEVTLQRTAHGPALTLVIKSGAFDSVQHKISIDIVASVLYKCNMSAFGWPRIKTERAFNADLIAQVQQAGTHLVPKHDIFWSVSFSRMERALQSGIDAGFGCRKFVLRILKKFAQMWKSQDSKYRNISSHIIKTQLFWSCEKHCDEPDYWNRNKRDLCLINTMEELEDTLRAGVLRGYFFVDINLLDGKPDLLLRSLADFIQEKRHCLMFPNLDDASQKARKKFVAVLLRP